jgi:Arc/MetJ-type ribon-helix-helix transcriptional regulator
MISVRLQEEMLSQVDEERERAGLSRAAAIIEALQLWVAKRKYADAVRSDQEGYERHPVGEDEFAPILEAQVWPE